MLEKENKNEQDMKEIKCPNCGSVITVDDAAFAALLSQVRTEEFDAEVNRRIDQFKELQKAEAAEKAANDAKLIEKAKIDCAKKLFNEVSTSKVRYHKVNSYDALLDVMKTLP